MTRLRISRADMTVPMAVAMLLGTSGAFAQQAADAPAAQSESEGGALEEIVVQGFRRSL